MPTAIRIPTNRPATYKTQPSPKQLKDALDEAIENVAYWKRRAAIALNADAKADCLARVNLWSSTRTARREALNNAR
jgi:hypothetical protein